jgi:hypothetical protein
VLVRPAAADEAVTITRAHEGLVYRSRTVATQAATELLAATDPSLPCYRTAGRNWFGSREEKATRDRALFSSDATPYLGEAFTASAAWHTLRALAALPPGSGLLPVWGLNHRVGLLELQRP